MEYTDNIGASCSVMINKLTEQTIANEFDSHNELHTSCLVPKLSLIYHYFLF